MSHVPLRFIYNHPSKIFLYFAINNVRPYTQLKYAGLCQMHDLIADVDKKNIPGSIIEMGCGQGGCGAFMARSTEKNGSYRDVWLFDSFEGLSEPTAEDFKETGKVKEKIKSGYLAVPIERAKEAIWHIGLSRPENVHITPGWFETSLPTVLGKIDEIAILRLDADLYEPTKYCLETLYDRVSQGGYVVIDDYKNWSGTRRALYEFFYKKNVNPQIQMYPYGGVAYFMKSN